MSGRDSAIRAPYQTVGPGLRALTLAALLTTLLLVSVGGLVRATGSGDACPDWPTCFGRLVPPLEYHTLIEYAHRLVASVAIGLIVVLAALALARYRASRRILWTSLAALALVLGQAALGGVVVLTGLNAALVTAHLATAMALVGVLVAAAVAARFDDARPGPPDRLVAVARGVAAAAFALLLIGATVRAEGAGLAFTDWPLMDGALLPTIDSPERALHVAHRVGAVAMVPLVAWLVIRARRDRAPTGPAGAPRAFAVLAASALLLQGVAGAFLVWSRLSAPAVVAHVTLASLLWAAVVGAAVTARATAPTTVSEAPTAPAAAERRPEPAVER